MSDGWYVVNAREREWFDRGPRGAVAILVEDEKAHPARRPSPYKDGWLP